MARMTLSSKHIQIDKANLTIVVATAIATFVTVFSLVAGRALLSQRSYQAKVIAKKEVAKKQLIANEQAVNQLQTSYKAFVGSPENVIGGSSSGSADRDGDNARIVLDALPSQYDFPALATSLEKLMLDRNVNIKGINGTDDELNQDTSAAPAGAAATPTPAATTAKSATALPVGVVEIPFDISFQTSYASTKDMIGVFERSIRPINVTKISFKADKDNQVQTSLNAKTYYQPAKKLTIKEVVVK